MTTAAEAATRNAPETDSRKTQVTVSRAIHVLSTEDEPLQVVTHRDRMCRDLENPDFAWISCNRGGKESSRFGDPALVPSRSSPDEVEWIGGN